MPFWLLLPDVLWLTVLVSVLVSVPVSATLRLSEPVSYRLSLLVPDETTSEAPAVTFRLSV
ncbi:MAG: hypothetical protein ACHQBP_07240, partial [Acidimicrobiales bacterium]